MNNELKLYLWPDHQCDYTCGAAFAVAHDETEARELIRQHPDNSMEPAGAPEVYNAPFGFSRWGGR